MSRLKVKELRTQRAKLVSDARKILNRAEGENRAMDTEEQAQWDQMMTTVDDLAKRVAALEQQMEEEDSEPDEEGEPDNSGGDGAGDDTMPSGDRGDHFHDGELRTFTLADGTVLTEVRKPGKGKKKRAQVIVPGSGDQEQRSRETAIVRHPMESEQSYRTRCRRSSPEYRNAWLTYLLSGWDGLRHSMHSRAIQADSDVIGGYLVAPTQFISDLIKFVDDMVFVRQKATKYTVADAQSLGAPSLDTDPADGDWTSELSTGNEDSSMAFGRRELTPHPLAKRIKVSNKLLRAAVLSAEGLVRQRLAYKFGITEEKAFMTGPGTQKPLGLFTASSRGISTGRDVVTGTTTNFTADALMDVKFSVKQQYMQNGEWIVHRDGMKRIRQLKDGNGQYLWGPGLNPGSPDVLLDRPVNMSEYAPNTFSTGLYVILFGQLDWYWIADAEAMQLQRLVELYAEANQVGFIARMELDGMPVLEEAFARGKLA